MKFKLLRGIDKEYEIHTPYKLFIKTDVSIWMSVQPYTTWRRFVDPYKQIDDAIEVEVIDVDIYLLPNGLNERIKKYGWMLLDPISWKREETSHGDAFMVRFPDG